MTVNARPIGLIVLTNLVLILSACGGGGGNGRLFSGGKICSINPEPVSMEVKNAEKVSLNPEDKAVIEGEYRYVSSEVYFKNHETGATFHVAQTPNEQKGAKSPVAFVSSIQCVRGLKFGEKPSFRYELEVVGHMSANPDGTFQVELKPITVGFSNKLDMEFKESKASNFTHPSKVYEASASDVIFYRTSENEQTKYEIRSLHEDGPVKIIVVVRFERKAN